MKLTYFDLMILNKTLYRFLFFALLLGLPLATPLSAQQVPGKDENIPFLVTFGKDAETSWGDDHFYQIFFLTIPNEYTKPFYIRVFDPDCGGQWDELKDVASTKTLFSVFGGKGVDPDKNEESKGLVRGSKYKTGNLLASKLFGDDPNFDNKYYTFGPFNPTDGDYNERWTSYIFKIVCQGVSGDDGNLYRYFLSSEAGNDIPIERANAFTYEYTFRMWNEFKSVAHIYPYIDTGIVFIKQTNFDWDIDGEILVVSRYKQGIETEISGEDNWVSKTIPIEPAEVNSSLDFQFHKKQDELVKNNNVVIKLENQRGDALKFYSSPIGGVPVYRPITKYYQIPKKK